MSLIYHLLGFNLKKYVSTLYILEEKIYDQLKKKVPSSIFFFFGEMFQSQISEGYLNFN